MASGLDLSRCFPTGMHLYRLVVKVGCGFGQPHQNKLLAKHGGQLGVEGRKAGKHSAWIHAISLPQETTPKEPPRSVRPSAVMKVPGLADGLEARLRTGLRIGANSIWVRLLVIANVPSHAKSEISLTAGRDGGQLRRRTIMFRSTWWRPVTVALNSDVIRRSHPTVAFAK